MARISYVGEGGNFRRLLNHSPAFSKGYWDARKALNDGPVAPKLRMLGFLAVDRANTCHY